ncbi:hypothetical protein JX265_013104 [Neoarthrinium moseri]|uniref:DUF6590 domain-containing protein n=1 Tax=Neoarthrinium moseri TaxID=1658444 RepID=A0A9Q0AHZ0_9PEZI|nr:uncharacterized protein JN550_006385 [Neoarthrinium moseri]KAI1849089.1 hypothetical protein JX266_005050 [Neoarthrinium moseri]KAI1852133.1 hypothetical protein JX265_013104 [Neoarthrinium moseri]KAI1868469.1 hypothetical protein JN550_006385 [Neoarthrinium moseri]
MPSYTGRSDSGFGDDGASGSTGSTQESNPDHPLAKKGYEIGTAANLQIGDVFEFLWADANEFEWEWKCLGYVRFIVLRHSETFPHHAVCIPISVGSKHNFAKPGVDSSQQGFVFDDDNPNQWHEKLEERNRLHFPPVGVELKPGKFRVKEDSRANYADIIEIDHDAQVIVVGTVVRYFDRLRRSVNKAVMRNILKKALSEYRAKRDKENGPPPKIEPSVVGQTFDEDEVEDVDDLAADEMPEPRVEPTEAVAPAPAPMSRDLPVRPAEERGDEHREGRREARREERREAAKTSSSMKLPQSRNRRKSMAQSAESKPVMNDQQNFGKSDYDLRSLHSVAMKGIKY